MYAKAFDFNVLSPVAINLRGNLREFALPLKVIVMKLRIGFTIGLAAAFLIATATSSVFAQKPKVNTLEIEQRLNDLGYWITKVDGRSDDSTRQAILAFQKAELAATSQVIFGGASAVSLYFIGRALLRRQRSGLYGATAVILAPHWNRRADSHLGCRRARGTPRQPWPPDLFSCSRDF